MPKRRVLLFSLQFDPVAAKGKVVATVRPRLLARYLPDEDWLPTVVTGAQHDSVERGTELIVRSVRTTWPIAEGKARAGVDNAVLQQMAATPSGSLRSRWRRSATRIAVELTTLVPDSLAWAIRASRAGVEIVGHEHPDAIYSTSPSPSAHLAAWLVARKTGLPWVAELRDLWSHRHDQSRTRLRRIPDVLLERLLFRRVSALVTVSQPLAERLKATYRHVPVYVAVTGFDPELYAGAKGHLADEFLILYAGRIYPERDLRHFLRPLANAIDSGRVDPARTRVELLSMGTLGAGDQAFIRERGLQDVVEERGFLPREEVIDRERTSQVLLHLRWDDPRETGVLTGKLFEYLAARRPILSTGRYRDAVSDLLEETGAGVASNTDEEAEAFLVAAYEAYASEGSVPYTARQDAIERYDARRTAATVATVLNGAVASKRDR